MIPDLLLANASAYRSAITDAISETATTIGEVQSLNLREFAESTLTPERNAIVVVYLGGDPSDHRDEVERFWETVHRRNLPVIVLFGTKRPSTYTGYGSLASAFIFGDHLALLPAMIRRISADAGAKTGCGDLVASAGVCEGTR